jgi:protocatechuate 4,5-dioxygenase, alpha chain
MVWKEHDYDTLPGTYVFDGKRAYGAYNLNKMAFSFNDEVNRTEFSKDMDAYCRRYNLPDEQREAVVNGEFLKLLQLGGNIYYLAKIAIFHGLSVQDVGAACNGITTPEFQARLDENAAPFVEQIKHRGGYWNG